MILLKDLFQNQYVYLAVSFCLTLLLAIAFRKLLDLTDALIYKKGGKPA
jgi:hypothetical protein